MNLLSVEGKGFRSFLEPFKLKFKEDIYYLLGENTDGTTDGVFDSNGAGKTSAVGIIQWILYGRLSTGSSHDSVIHDEGEQVWGRVRFDSLTVERTKTRGSVESLFFIHGGTRVDGDIRPTQAALTAILGLSSSLFGNTVWIDRESRAVQFLFSPPAKRLEILEEILNDSLYSRTRKLASNKLSGLETSLASIKKSVENLKAENAQRRQQLIRSHGDYQAAASKLSDRARKNAHRVGQVEDEIAQLKKLTTESGSLESTREELSSERKLLQSYREHLTYWRTMTHVQGLKEGEPCPACFRSVSSLEIAAVSTHVELANTKIRHYTHAVKQKESLIGNLEDRFNALQKADNTIKNKGQRILALQRELELLRDNNEDPSLAAFSRTIKALQASLLEDSKKMDTFKRQAMDIAREMPRYKIWEEGFGVKGIRNMLLDDVRKLLRHFSVRYMSLLAGTSMVVSFPDASDKFDILIHGASKHPRDIADFSKGEVWRANLAILLGLRKTVHHLNRTQLRMTILDDPFGDVDETGAGRILQIAEKLPAELGVVLMTAPRVIPGMDPSKIIRVRKTNNRSVIL